MNLMILITFLFLKPCPPTEEVVVDVIDTFMVPAYLYQGNRMIAEIWSLRDCEEMKLKIIGVDYTCKESNL